MVSEAELSEQDPIDVPFSVSCQTCAHSRPYAVPSKPEWLRKEPFLTCACHDATVWKPIATACWRWSSLEPDAPEPNELEQLREGLVYFQLIAEHRYLSSPEQLRELRAWIPYVPITEYRQLTSVEKRLWYSGKVVRLLSALEKATGEQVVDEEMYQWDRRRRERVNRARTNGQQEEETGE